MGFIYVLHKIALREEREGCARVSLVPSFLRYIARQMAQNVILAVFHALLVVFLGFPLLLIRLLTKGLGVAPREEREGFASFLLWL